MNSLRPHPIYKNYGYDLEKEQIVHIKINKTTIPRIGHCGYSYVTVSGDAPKQKMVLCHRFIWECCNDIIPKNYEIDHINKNKTDNSLENLRCVTISENRKNRDHTNILKYAKIAHTLKRFIKAINIDTNEVLCFKCKNQCSTYLGGISAALVYLIVANKNMAKTASTNKGKYKFEYVDEKDVENLINVPRKERTHKLLTV